MESQLRTPPRWWNRQHDSAWHRVKAAFRRDWHQTQHDFGGSEPDLNQNVDDTVGQAMGTRPVPADDEPTCNESCNESSTDDPGFEKYEPAFRYGYGAYVQYGDRHAEWNDDLEFELQKEWGTDWDQFRPAIRRGWDYSKMTAEMSKASNRVMEK